MSINSYSEGVSDTAIAKFVELFSRQIKAAMDEERTEISALSKHLLNSHALVSNKNEETDEQVMIQEMNAAIAKLQFADRLSQRLSNVANNLEKLGSFLLEHHGKVNHQSLEEILEEINFKFSMESERRLLNEIIGVAAECGEKEPSKDNIPELF